MKPMVLTPKELRADLKAEQARPARLEAQLQRAQAEIEPLRVARDSALRVAAWGGLRRTDGGTRHEH